MARVRLATAADVLRVVDWCCLLNERIDCAIKPDRPWVASVIARLIGSPDSVVFVSDGGFIAGSLQPTLASPQIVAMEHGWYSSDGSGRALLAAFENWAAERGAVLIQLSTGATGPDLSRIGYRMTEKAWVR